MSWNYRLCRFDDRVAVHEAHYNADGVVFSVTLSPAIVMVADDDGSDTAASMHWQLDRMREAIAKPVLLRRDDGTWIEETN